ncbi:hypothetical protein [Plesiomonas shigelloides]|uniref:hypothetical protein n=1 Tax=Plesiomonas shigelloides TaxID=703 RepID=UPI000579E85A|nr:hypothetical protein [Plesiomonas shigelloides]
MIAWFIHNPMSSEEAVQLLAEYQRRGLKAMKSLSDDKTLWVVSVAAPKRQKLQPTPQSMINRLWR